MRFNVKFIISVLCIILFAMVGAGLCFGQMKPGHSAPVFSLKDGSGKTYDLTEMKSNPMIILYFFDIDSKPSQEGLISLDQLAKQYKNADLIVWGITLSSEEKTANFVSENKPDFPIMLDTSGVSDLYQARLILPTVCILGPELKILDYFQGGGKTTEIMLVRLAERKLQRRQTGIAKAISDHVTEKNPENLDAKTVKGYAALKEGNLDEAEKVFQDLSQDQGQGEVLGKEGLTAVYAQKGQIDKALMTAEEVEKKAPDRAYVHVIKGDLLYSQNKKEAAESEYLQAVEKKEAATFQKSVAYNQLGRFNAGLGKFQKARELYDQAVDIDPYYIEATSNKGMTYGKEGNWDKALDMYRQTLNLAPNDTIATVLAKKAQDMLDLQKNAKQKERIDKLVKELAERYRSRKKFWAIKEDTWTSRPMVLSFVDFYEKGMLAERDGFSAVLTTQLTDELNASGRLQVVERALIERLLEELNLGASDLADPETALKLGKVLAAKIIGTGSIYHLPTGTLLSLRLIDTETSAIPKVFNWQLDMQASLNKELHRFNREILKAIVVNYPLQGYLIQAEADQVVINLGSKQGVVLGTKFEALEEQEPIKYKGKVLEISPKPVAQIEVIRVEPDLSYGRILQQIRPLKKDDKVKEKMEDTLVMGAGRGGGELGIL
ncbi:MAG: tetratricopeptide repeat protein [Desulfobacterales bacterium]|nr:tetratricopeptide repeat protein [Desulfobacterales bacterium]